MQFDVQPVGDEKPVVKAVRKKAVKVLEAQEAQEVQGGGVRKWEDEGGWGVSA